MNILFWAELRDKIFGPVTKVQETLDLVLLGLKIVILLFIVSFVRSRFGGGPITTILVLVLGYVILFQQWMIFGPMMIIYLFIIFGFSAIVFDLAIAKPWRKMPGEGPPTTGKQITEEAAERRSMFRKRIG